MMYCPHCGQKNEDNVKFCAFCGGKTERENKSQSTKSKKRLSKPFWVVVAAMVCVVAIVLLIPKVINPNFSYSSYLKGRSHYLLEYLNDVGNQPLLVYQCRIAKEAQVYNIYVITDEGCRNYHAGGVTLGELAKMTDEEILKMLETKYQEGWSDAVYKWKVDPSSKSAIERGEINIYKPSSYPIQGCLLTDETGNTVKGELLFFPVTGVGRTPYVIENTADPSSFRYYNSREDNDSVGEIDFDNEYFNTGYGSESDANEINDIFYITEDSVKTGTVYDSHYYGMGSNESDWAEAGMFCIRVDNPDKFYLEFDEITASEVTAVDPTKDEILAISHEYYNAYYNSFEPLK